MKIIRIEHDNITTYPPIDLVVGDENSFADAEELFKKNHETCEIKNMKLISERVINQWAQ